MGKRKKCRCNIRGVVWIGRIHKPTERGTIKLVHPDLWEKNLRKFKYCPLCGVKI